MCDNYRLLRTLKIVYSDCFGTEKGQKQALPNYCFSTPFSPSLPSLLPLQNPASQQDIHTSRESIYQSNSLNIEDMGAQELLTDQRGTQDKARNEAEKNLFPSLPPRGSEKGEKRANPRTRHNGVEAKNFSNHSFLFCFQHSCHP